MAYVPIVGDIFIVSVFTQLGQQEAVNDFNIEVTAVTAGGLTDQELIEAIDDDLAPLYKLIACTDASYRGMTIRKRVAVPLRPVTKHTNANQGACSSGALPLPSQTCGLISWKTDFGGRSQQGRTYLPFPSATDDVTPGMPTIGYVGSAGDIGTYVITPHTYNVVLRSTSIVFGVWSALVPTLHVTPWVTFVVPQAWATQKRRGAFGRFNREPF